MFDDMNKENIIVSMTSFPGRISLVPVAFKHFISTQTVKANYYVLWLSRAEFNGEKTSQELGLAEIESLGVEIHWCDEDSKIHIRHNSIKLWPEAYNIMIDEDIIYPSTYIEELLFSARKYPNCIISYFAEIEMCCGYRKKYHLPKLPWPSSKNKFNGGLVCFPPNTYPMVCFKYENIRDRICPFHDETWVNLFAEFLGIKIYGCHQIDWDIIKNHSGTEDVTHLRDKHNSVKEKYSFDLQQFNRCMYVFPELKKAYNRNHLFIYQFHDKEELDKYKDNYNIIHKIL